MKTALLFSAFFLAAGTLLLSSCETAAPLELQSGSSSATVPADAPRLTYIWPDQGKPGTTLHLYGENFSPVDWENLIWIGEVDALGAKILSPRELVITVPTDAKTGAVRITIAGKSHIGPVFTVTYDD